LGALCSDAQNFDERHNPGFDINLSPQHNAAIHPERNSTINPRLNWNINPYKNGLINPEKVAGINPKSNSAVNPTLHQEMNPMYSVYMLPKSETWHGLYLFDSTNNLAGYITQYSQDLLIQFNKESVWTYFYVRTAKGTYNQFNLDAQWTGSFLCFDSMSGFNLFDKQCAWTGFHIK